ncbi:MAG: discoidin domain-containing protein [Terrimicrobiaceae bacterium]
MQSTPRHARLLQIFAVVSGLTGTALAQPAAPALAPVQPVAVKADSENPKYPATNAIDGAVSDASRWVSQPFTQPVALEINLGSKQKLGGAHIFSGFGNKDAVESFSMQFWKDGRWVEIPSATVDGNKATAVSVPFDQTVDVVTDKIRLLVRKSSKDIARIKELVLWPFSVELPALPLAAPKPAPNAAPAASQAKMPEIYLNQSGFDFGRPKKFTAPTLADGTAFTVRPAKGGAAAFSGTIKGNKGDFTGFNPTDENEYVVEAGGITSVPFRIGQWWLERVTYQNMVNFMIDSRHRLGNERDPCVGSYGWRDDHHFGWELTTLVPQYISNPSAYDRMPRQITYETPANAKVWGALQPPAENAPDIVKLIHWGADVIVTQRLSHEMLKSQLAYFLYAWPALKQFLPQQNYDAVRDYAFKTWADSAADRKYPYDESSDHNLLAVKTKIGPTKGSFPPGFSVEPNLLMYEVAKRENRPDAELYLNAAKAQADWMIENLDWAVPQVTKGQRMSEFVTITGLANFLRLYPDKAPAGLANKIADWAKVMIRRSDNMWDFRKLDDADGWTPMEAHPQKWNEPGNVVGLPAALLAAKQVVADPKMKARLDEIAWAQFDNMFGRNPTGRHFSYQAPRDIEGVENGWFTFCPGGIGKLARARFVLDGSPKNFHYPYHPEVGNKGYTEGWIQFNTPFNASMAYLAFDQIKISAIREGNEIVVRLRAPLNFDYQKAESASVQATSSLGDVETITLTEESPNSEYLTGRIPIQESKTAKPSDGKLQSSAGGEAEISYGFGHLGHSVKIRP